MNNKLLKSETLKTNSDETHLLTKRELFAITSLSSIDFGNYNNPAEIAYDAVRIADALILELKETNNS